MATEVAGAGPAELTWDRAARFATLRFVEAGEGGRDAANDLKDALLAWVGNPAEPYDFLVDCSEIVDVDASWRAIWGDHFRAHRDVATVSWFNANPRIQLVVVLFIKGTGVNGKPFEHEAEARAWLADQRRLR